VDTGVVLHRQKKCIVSFLFLSTSILTPWTFVASNAGFFMLFLGIFLLWTTWSLYQSISSEQIGHHPVFRPDCYHPQRTTNLSQSAPPTQRSMNRPRPSNDAEMGTAPPKSPSSNKKKGIKMKPGAIMKLRGMKAKPQLNGSSVRLIKRPEGTEGRWEVTLLDGGSELTVSESKLVPV
jgi:hypothetical protein